MTLSLVKKKMRSEATTSLTAHVRSQKFAYYSLVSLHSGMEIVEMNAITFSALAITISSSVGVFGVGGQAHSSAMAFKAWTAPTPFLVRNFHISVRACTHVHEIYFKRLYLLA